MKKYIILKKHTSNIIFLLLLVIIFIFIPIPAMTIKEKNENPITQKIKESKKIAKIYNTTQIGYHTITAYNSEVAQCDSSPCITANGFNVCKHGIEDTLAINSLKFGTKVRIPNLFGDKIFTVRDRTNKRYTNRVDIWMINKQDALNFGVKKANLEILK